MDLLTMWVWRTKLECGHTYAIKQRDGRIEIETENVVEGNEPGGITTHARWQGGGGFRFFRLAPRS